MCNTCFNRFLRSMNSFLIFFKLKVMLIFKILANIQINIDQCCYTKIIYKVYFDSSSRNKIFLA